MFQFPCMFCMHITSRRPFLKTLELSFDHAEDSRAFFDTFNPGQFCLLSVAGKGESALGVASAAWEGDFVRFTAQKMGSVTLPYIP